MYASAFQPTDALMHRFFNLAKSRFWMGYTSVFHAAEYFFQAELPDIRFHDLRHSAATLLLSLGVHPKVVQELLGHTQISMTMDIYSHVLPGLQQDTMSKLNTVFKQSDDGSEAT